jgi:methylated-DNA-[protein]-cysteine S-methyltransferase
MYCCTVETPIGPLLLAGDEDALRRVYFQRGRRPMRRPADWEVRATPFREVTRQLRAYFARTLTTFDLPLAPEGTDFQRTVWHALQTIRYGRTCSYGELARRIGSPAASRAVGAANGRNPIPIIIPCHRVIGADGTLTGFGGGVPIKRQLLELEGSWPTRALATLF